MGGMAFASTSNDDNTKQQNDIENNLKNENIATSIWNKSMLDYAEDQFQCCICTEMIINAVTLNCSHTFCSYCILQWKQRKSYCPICRVKIKVQLKTKIIDSFIDKLVSNSSTEIQSTRKVLKEEREENEKKLKGAMECSCNTCDSYDFEDDDDDDDDEDDYDDEDFEESDDDIDSSSLLDVYYDNRSDMAIIDGELEDLYVNGGRHGAVMFLYNSDSEAASEIAGFNSVPLRQNTTEPEPTFVNGGYYGGYGRCFNCGETGHWRGGCPQRRNYHTYGACFSCGEHGHWANNCPNR